MTPLVTLSMAIEPLATMVAVPVPWPVPGSLSIRVPDGPPVAGSPAFIAVLVAVLAAGVVLLGSPPARWPRSGVTAVPRVRSARSERSLLRDLRPPLSGLAFLAGWSLLGGLLGILAGALAAAISWRVLGHAESPAERRRRERLRRDLPVGVRLLAGSLQAGSAVGPALRTVGEAFGGPLGEEFGRVHRRLALGTDPGVVWRDLAADPQLGALGRCLGRAHDSGASVAAAVIALATELRSRAEAEVEERARSVDVRASAPLGICLLPAFLLLGVVPLVAAILGRISFLG